MNRYHNMFTSLTEQRQGAFIPFVMLGDPDLDSSFAIIKSLIAGGADALELGIPFSDPIADGPTIQAASIRALNNGVTPDNCLALVAKIRAEHPDIPMGLLMYSNLVFAKGIDSFYAQCAASGVDSVLVADVPIREAEPFKKAANANGIQHILIAPPNATAETLQAIGDHSEGYTYLLGRAGVTGTETAAVMPASNLVAKLRDVQAAPAILGFGISTPVQVEDAIQAGAAGAISGSATVKIIEYNLGNITETTAALTEFVSAMKTATHY